MQMKPEADLLERFFNGQCTAAETRRVLDWLLQQPDANLWEADWEQVAAEGQYPDGYKAEMLEHIHNATYVQQTPVRRIPWKSISVAASIALLIGLVCWHSLPTRQQQSIAQQVPGAVISKPVTWIASVNTTPTRLQLALPDGSVVTLEHGATLRYDSATFEKQRELYLQGKANFQVNASATKPFSVHTGAFTTVALGTTFMVHHADNGDLTVKLFSGKLLVAREEKHETKYLQPGEAFHYRKAADSTTLQPFERTEIKNSASNKDKGIIIYADAIIFNNTPLKDVLHVLQQQYHVNVQYQGEAVQHVYFSGKILPQTDSLETILQTIARLNKLSVSNGNNGYFIQ